MSDGVLKPELLEPEGAAPFSSVMQGLTSQEARFVLLRCSGMSLRQSAAGAGYTPEQYRGLIEKRAIKDALEAFKTKVMENVVFGVTEAHMMLMEAWANAATSTEQRLVVEALMKLHKLGSDGDKKKGGVTININKLDQLSDSELLRLAGKAEEYLDPDE